MLRAALADEFVEDGPEVALVSLSELEADVGKGLTRAGAGPHGTVFGPSGKLEGEGPPRNPAEEVCLRKTFKIGCMDFGDGSFIDDAVGDQFAGDQFPEPRGGVGVELVVEVHCSTSGTSRLPVR